MVKSDRAEYTAPKEQPDQRHQQRELSAVYLGEGRSSTQIAIKDPAEFDTDIGDHSGQMCRADHGTRNFGHDRVLKAHRETQERNGP